MESTKITLPELLKSYLDSVMASTSFEGVGPEQRETFVLSVQSRASDVIMKIVMEQLSDEDFQSLITGIEAGADSPEEQARLMDDAIGKIPEFAEKLVPALIALRSQLTISL